MPTSAPICLDCKHHLFGRECMAFKEIPESIWLGENDHKTNVPGDSGIKFEPFEESEA